MQFHTHTLMSYWTWPLFSDFWFAICRDPILIVCDDKCKKRIAFLIWIRKTLSKTPVWAVSESKSVYQNSNAVLEIVFLGVRCFDPVQNTSLSSEQIWETQLIIIIVHYCVVYLNLYWINRDSPCFMKICVMIVVPGWPGLYLIFLKKNPHARISELLRLFMIFSLYTSTFFPSSWQVTDASSMKDFYPDCIANSWHCIWVHQFEISVLLGEWSSEPTSPHKSLFAPRNVYPSISNQCRRLTGTATHCAFLLNINISEIHGAHTLS
jgi:hypothetical protein